MRMFSAGLGLGIISFLVTTCEGVNRPKISPNHTKTLTITKGESFELTCTGEKPLAWNHNGTNLVKTNSSLSSKQHTFSFRYTLTLLRAEAGQNDTGNYSCSYAGSNNGAASADWVVVQLEAGAGLSFWSAIKFIALLILLVALVLLIASAGRTKYKEYKLVSQNKAFARELEEGTLQKLKEKVDGHPFKSQIQFPLKGVSLIGMDLRLGQFARVQKGVAYGLVEKEKETVVAVKTTKSGATTKDFKGLLWELKILATLVHDRHVNVLYLMGASTENIHKRELHILVEYCKHENLLRYMEKKQIQCSFINQLDSEKDCIDVNITGPGSSGQVTVINETDCLIGSEEEPLATINLLFWAAQIARGMRHLESLKVIHGSLAAKNILLAESGAVKISDFRLARIEDDEQNELLEELNEDVSLPLKWMAIETVLHKIASFRSDCWSFGVVLWEMFTLGDSPYSTMKAHDELFKKISEGYRMEKPKYAPSSIYDIMTECWAHEPTQRPSFSELADKLEAMVKEVRSSQIKDTEAREPSKS